MVYLKKIVKEDFIMKKMVEIWIDQHTLKVLRATVVEAHINAKEGFSGMYNSINFNAVYYIDGDDIYPAIKKVIKAFKKLKAEERKK